MDFAVCGCCGESWRSLNKSRSTEARPSRAFSSTKRARLDDDLAKRRSIVPQVRVVLLVRLLRDLGGGIFIFDDRFLLSK